MAPPRGCSRSSRLFFFLCCCLLVFENSPAGEIRPSLAEVLRTAGPRELVPVTIVMVERVPLAEVRQLARRFDDRSERRGAVAGRLQRTASESQRPLLELLRAEERSGRAVGIRPLWLVNVVGARLTPGLIERVARWDGVDRINHNAERAVFLDGDPLPAGSASAPSGASSETECGTDLIGAPEVWDTLAVRGEGAVVAVIDSGVCYYHPDIRRRIWVNPGEDLDRDGAVMDSDDLDALDNDGNGFVDDLIGWNFDGADNDPDDTTTHGSHVAGTVAGDGTSGTRAGVAPAAEIMVLKVGTYFTDEADVWGAMEYAAANGADVMSMSLGWPHDEDPDRETWRYAAENAIEMGTAVVVSAGNEGGGNAPDNVRTPGDVPRVITAGATDCNDALADFSSRGPVTWQDVPPFFDHPYPPGLVKPDVAAPGVDTVSHYLCNGYTEKSGTSMAAPHVSGTVALLASANPTLEHDEIKALLEQHALDLGAPGKDNAYGSGRIDALATVSAVVSPVVHDGHVVDDSAPAHGNGDGDLDSGEIATVAVTLRDRGGSGATNVWARLGTTKPGVEVLDDVAFYPDIAPGGAAESLAPHYTVRFHSGCGRTVDFLLTVHHDEDRVSHTRFTLTSGFRHEEVFLEDDMEADRGWTPGGNESANPFVREDPHRVVLDSTTIQPEDDATPFPGILAWVTGNPFPGGGFDPADGDVDFVAWLDSPVFDAAGGDELTVDYSRWVFLGEQGVGDTAHFRLEISNDGGGSYSEVERLNLSGPGWVDVSLAVGVPPTGAMRLRFYAVDQESAGTPGDVIVETLIDDVSVRGARYVCEEFSEPDALAPNPVGDTLRTGATGAGTRLDWQAPPTDAEHDAATTYEVHRSSSPGGGFALYRNTTATFAHDDAAVVAGEALYYVVVSRNGGGTSGERPPAP